MVPFMGFYSNCGSVYWFFQCCQLQEIKPKFCKKMKRVLSHYELVFSGKVLYPVDVILYKPGIVQKYRNRLCRYNISANRSYPVVSEDWTVLRSLIFGYNLKHACPHTVHVLIVIPNNGQLQEHLSVVTEVAKSSLINGVIAFSLHLSVHLILPAATMTEFQLLPDWS
jgi:hypothetical protein